MKEIIQKLVEKEELSFEEIQRVIKGVVKNDISEAQLGAFLVAVTQKEVTKDEFFYFASAMREFSNRVVLNDYIVDSCGTGADLSKTINISTASAIVANACGVNVIKQTNSAITSKCGSTDLLNALDINIARIPQVAKAQFAKNKISFVHSPYFNEFARVNNPIRQQLGIKTIFNYLGPMINPSFPNAQLLGVSSNQMCEKMVYALQKLGTDRALVVNGINPNIDEISICSKTSVYELKNGKISYYEVSPKDFGYKKADISEIQGGNAAENVRVIQEILKCTIKGAKQNIICMNAGAMIYLAGLAPDMFKGAEIAKKAIENGMAYQNLLKLSSGVNTSEDIVAQKGK